MKNDKLKYTPVDYDPFAAESPLLISTTEAQREIWTNIQIGGHDANCAYNESVTLAISGHFRSDLIQQSVDILFSRHQALRSTFSEDGHSMIIHPSVNVPVQYFDHSLLTDEQKSEAFRKITDAEAENAFDLSSAPLGRIIVIKNSDSDFLLILTFHHIVCDGWSLGIVLQDLSNIYNKLAEGNNTSLPEPVLFSEYAKSEEDFKYSDEYKQTEQYWFDKYKDKPVEMQLPANKTRPLVRTYKAERFDVKLDSELIAGIRKTGASTGTSFITALTAAFELFLHRITGQTDVVLGLAAAGQSATGMENLVGHCVNLLLLRSSIDPRISFVEYLKARKPDILDAYDNQRYTFGTLVRKINLRRSAGQIPMVPVSFNVDLGLTNGVEFKDCTYTFSTNPRHYENFELFINASGSENDFVLECTYNTDIFISEMIRLRIDEFVCFLRSLNLYPSKPVSRLNILTAQETENIFNRWQGDSKDYYDGSHVYDLIDQFAGITPEATAIRYLNSAVSFAALKNITNVAAVRLAAAGICNGKKVAVYLPRSVNIIPVLLAVMKAGGCYVPVDITYPSERVNYILKDSGCDIVVTTPELERDIENSGFNIMYENSLFTKTKNEVSEFQAVESKPDSPAYMIYTSGSTGMPKGVVISHFALINYISWANRYYFGERDFGKFSLYSSLSFDLTVTSIYCCLTRGKTLTVHPQEDDILTMLTDMFSGKLDTDSIKMTPAHILLLEDSAIKNDTIKKAIVGGEELTTKHVAILRSINAQMEIVNEYGPTEVTVGCVIKDVIEPADCKTIGRPIANTQVYVLDNSMMPLPPGISGNLYLGGYSLAAGYHNRQELTDEKFKIISLGNDFIRLYNSGDLAKFKLNGELEFLGRSDDQVKIRGYRIELGEVESLIMKLANVSNVVVVVREDIPGDKRLAAYIIPDTGTPDPVYYFEKLRDALPDYMVPSSITFLNSFPLTGNGKIDKKALPAPDVSSKLSGVFEEPKTTSEQLIANIWCDILKLERVGRNDNFFELGGHSLLGVRMFSEIEKQTGVKLNLSVLFTAPTIRDLVPYLLKEGPSKPVPSLVTLQPGGNLPPLFCVHMHNGNINRWRVLVKHLGNNRPVYAIQPVGLNINSEPHRSIEEMAEYYIGVMKSAQPTGPYNLVGLCFSGMVVYEMAVRLQKLGEKVAFLGMVNNYAPPENRKLYRLKSGLNKFMKMELGEQFNYAFDKNLKFGKSLLKKAGILKDTGGKVEEIEIDVQDIGEVGHDLRTIHSLALLNYHPDETYHGNLFLFRTSDPIEDLYNEYLGWDRLVKGSIETTIIPGSDTDTIITDEPYNITLSNAIKAGLEKEEKS